MPQAGSSDTEEILGCDGVAADLGEILDLAEFFEQFEDFALQLLHPRHRDIEEIAGAAGGIERYRGNSRV